MHHFRELEPSEPMPHFSATGGDGSLVSQVGMGGPYLLLLFPGRLDAEAVQALAQIIFFHVPDHPAPSIKTPGLHMLRDHDGGIVRRFGALPSEGKGPFRPRAILIDPMLRVIANLPATTPAERAQVFDLLAAQPPAARFADLPLHAPVLVLPHVFPPALCAALIERSEADGGQASGIMRVIDGKTVGVHDPLMKVPRNYLIADHDRIARIQTRIRRSVLPEIRKVHAFEMTRMERYVVGCYRAEDKGHFAPHRDNTTPATAYRRFAISIALNDGYEGGEISFT